MIWKKLNVLKQVSETSGSRRYGVYTHIHTHIVEYYSAIMPFVIIWREDYVKWNRRENINTLWCHLYEQYRETKQRVRERQTLKTTLESWLEASNRGGGGRGKVQQIIVCCTIV